MGSKSVVYRGVVYTRYEGRRYYNPNGKILASGGTSLHRQVWLDAGREIPSGWHIHHVDHDNDNNDISNLECLPASEHLRRHHAERITGDLGEKLSAWRRSDDGRATLRANARKMRERTPERSCSCGNCGKPFTTRHPTKAFCSAACGEQAGYRQVEKDCPICGARFWAKHNSNKATQTCSYRCGWALRRKKAGLQPHG